MKAKEAIGILRNAEFLGTEKDCQNIEDAINVIEKYLETFRWHPYPEENPDHTDSYICLYDKAKLPYHDVCRFVDDLYAFDNVDFAKYKRRSKRKSGFVEFSECGWFQNIPDAWMPIPGYDAEITFHKE